MTGRRQDIRVLHVVSSTDRRGAEVAAVDICAALLGEGYAGSVVALARGAIGGLDVPVLGPSRFAPAGLRALRFAASNHDLVVAHGSSTLPAVSAATAGSGRRFVYRSIGDPAIWSKTLARRARVSLAVRRAAAVVALWRGSAVFWHEILGVPVDRIHVIPNGVDIDQFPLAGAAEKAAARDELGLVDVDPLAVYLGALSPEKRVDLAIAAVSATGRVGLAIVGDGPGRISLQESIRALPGGRIRMMGATESPWTALAAADVVVLPSDTEGLPAAAIEAGLVGRPVVATRVGGLAEIVLDGRTGVLVEPGDISGLAGAIFECLRHREEWGHAARAHLEEKFDIRRIAGKWGALLQSVIKS